MALAAGGLGCAVDDRNVGTLGRGGSEAVASDDGDAATQSAAGSGAGGSGAAGSGFAVLPAGGGAGASPGRGPARLTATPDSLDLGDAEVGASGADQDWTITNEGGTRSSPLALSNSNSADFEVDNSCPTQLEAGASCRIHVTFSPDLLGPRSGTLDFGNASDGAVSLALAGTGKYRVTLSVVGGGRVNGLQAAPCLGECSVLLDAASSVSLQAQTDNGSDLMFQSWSLADCPGPLRSCLFPVAGSVTLRATFGTRQHNIAFMSSSSYTGGLGGLAAYDQQCNQLATAAGINSANGQGYVALMSDDTQSFLDRLGPAARGWVRMDGRPFIDRFQDLITQQTLLYPPHFDELGASTYLATGTALYWTGTALDGTLPADPTRTCNEWTDSTSTALTPFAGFGNRGPFNWAGTAGNVSCSSSLHILCLGNTSSAAVIFAGDAGKRIWVTDEPYVPGIETPDAHCDASAPPGVAVASALVAYTNQPAQALLEPSTNYVRVDGVSVGTGAEIAALNPLSGIWITGSGARINSSVWTGSSDLTSVGTTTSTCGNWTTTTGTSPVGSSAGSDRILWNFFSNTSSCASSGLRLYCIER